MEATAKEFGNPNPSVEGPRVGEHVHQLLHLAKAIVHAAADIQASEFTDTPLQGASERQPITPFGLQLGSLSDQDCVEWTMELESLGRFQQALSVQAAGELADRVAAGRFLQAGVHAPVAMLVQSVKISAAEARRRIRLSETLLPHRDILSGAVTAVLQPVLCKSYFGAQLSVEHALMISNFVEEAQGLAKAGLISDDLSYEVEASLVATGEESDPDFLRHAGNRIMAHLDPDGQKPTEGDLIAKQGLFFRKPRRGLIHFDGHMNIEQYEHLLAAIGTATNPNKHGSLSTTEEPNRGQDRTARAEDQDAALETLGEIVALFGSDPQSSTHPELRQQEPAGCTKPTSSVGPTRTGASQISTGTSQSDASSADTDNGEEVNLDDDHQAKDPWIVDGVRIPRPGSMEELEGLNSLDPHSTDPAVKDRRTRAQKLLDGLLDCVKLAARSGKLPLNGGLKTQLIITTTEEDISRRDGTGTAFTTYNGPVPLHLFAQSLCDPDITHLYLGDGQNILNAGRAQRLFTAAQRKILLSRDLGCAFPDCTMPAPWTEAHHILPWQEGGETNINNAVLLCAHHHGLLHHSNWTVELISGTAYFTAPYLIDPGQTPRRNKFHHGISVGQVTAGELQRGPADRRTPENPHPLTSKVPDAAKAPIKRPGPSLRQEWITDASG